MLFSKTVAYEGKIDHSINLLRHGYSWLYSNQSMKVKQSNTAYSNQGTG